MLQICASDIYKDGYYSHMCGKPKITCPHVEDSFDAKEWDCAWEDAAADAIQFKLDFTRNFLF